MALGGYEGVFFYIVVDIFATRCSAQSHLPKSGYAVYSQGKVVAKLVNARLKGRKPEEEYVQMVCYAMVSGKEAIMTETSFRYVNINERFIPTHRENNKRKEINVKRYEEWTKGLWRDLFG